jgi:thioredoxin 1
MKEAIVVFVIALVIGAGINQWQAATSATAEQPQSQTQPQTQTQAQTPGAGGGTSGEALAATNSVPETSDATFQTDVLNSREPVFVDFNATWCGPCKLMAPIVAELAGEYQGKAKFYSMDVDKSPSTAAKYNVNAIPTFIIFKGGKRGESFTGVVPKSDLTGALIRTL